MTDRLPLKLRAARWAAVTLRLARRPVLTLPGLAGFAAVALAAGELAGHIFGRGLTPWVALLVGGGFSTLIGWELNRTPPAPRQPDD